MRALPFYYGWVVLVAGALAEMLAQGATSYAAGLFVLPLQAEFHLSRADASSAILILFCGVILASPLVGWAFDRYAIRWVMAAGALLFALSLAAIAMAPSPVVMALLLFIPAAFGFMAIGPLLTSTLAARWFWRRRGLALGIAAVATSGGGLLVVPFLSAAIAAHGWRQALLGEAVIVGIVIILLALLLVRDHPATLELDADPENAGRIPAVAAATRWHEVLASGDFWIPSLTLAAISGTAQAIVTLLVPYAAGLGHAVASAAFLVSAFAGAAAVTKIVAGLLADHLEQRLMLAAAALSMALAWLLLGLAASYAALLAASGLAGVALGCALPTTGALIAARFGAERFGGVMGATYCLISAAAIGAVRFSGWVFDRTGNYDFSFRSFAILLGCLLLATLYFARRGRAA